MKRKAYESDPIPSQLTHNQYKYGTRDYVIIEEMFKDTLLIKEALNFITSDNPRTKYKYALQQKGYDISRARNQELNANYLPTKNIRIPVNKDAVLENGIVKEKDADLIVSHIDIQIKGNALYKNRLLMLDIVANNNWERAIYFTGGAFGDDDYIWMKDYLQLDGLCYKLVPIKTPVDKANPFDMGRIDSELMYDLIKDWDWGNSGSDAIYHDVETRKNGISYRGNLARLIETFINEEQFDKAEEIADLAMEKMPVGVFGYYTLLEPFIGAYYEVKAKDKGRGLYNTVSKKYQESLTYFSALSEEKQGQRIEEISTDIGRYRGLIDVLMIYEDQEFVEAEMQKYNNFIRLFTGEEPEPIKREDIDILPDSNAIDIDSSNE